MQTDERLTDAQADLEMTRCTRMLRWLMITQAENCQDDRITPDHLFMALCLYEIDRFGDWKLHLSESGEMPPDRAAWAARTKPIVQAASVVIATAFSRAFPDHLLSARDRLWDAAMQVAPKPGRVPVVIDRGDHEEVVYSRTEETKVYFVRADSLADGRPTPIHLLAALLENPVGTWSNALVAFETTHYRPGVLKAAVAAALQENR